MATGHDRAVFGLGMLCCILLYNEEALIDTSSYIVSGV